ncbi:hypothetical protein, partial [Candidatus Erwinia dacicola]
MADSAGNTSTATGNFTVDTVAPQVSVEALTGDNRISSAESSQLQTLSCTGENGDRITVTLNGETYITPLATAGASVCTDTCCSAAFRPLCESEITSLTPSS